MKSRSPHRCFALWTLVVVALSVGMPSAAHAGAALDPFCPAMNGIVQRIVLCIQDTILERAYALIDAIYPYFEGAIAAFLTLSVIFFGVRMVMPMLEKPGRDTMIFVLKVGGVTFFTQNMYMILY